MEWATTSYCLFLQPIESVVTLSQLQWIPKKVCRLTMTLDEISLVSSAVFELSTECDLSRPSFWETNVSIDRQSFNIYVLQTSQIICHNLLYKIYARELQNRSVSSNWQKFIQTNHECTQILAKLYIHFATLYCVLDNQAHFLFLSVLFPTLSL